MYEAVDKPRPSLEGSDALLAAGQSNFTAWVLPFSSCEAFVPSPKCPHQGPWWPHDRPCSASTAVASGTGATATAHRMTRAVIGPAEREYKSMEPPIPFSEFSSLTEPSLPAQDAWSVPAVVCDGAVEAKCTSAATLSTAMAGCFSR